MDIHQGQQAEALCAAVEAALALEGSLDAVQPCGLTLLQSTAELGSLELTRRLLQAGAQPDLAPAPLFWARRPQWGYAEEQEPQPEAEQACHTSRPPLTLAAAQGHLGIVEALLAAGANPQVPDLLKRTALHATALAGHAAVAAVLAERLAAASADALHALDAARRTPLHVAAKYGHEGVVAALLAAGADPNCTDLTDHRPPLHLAAEGSFAGTVRLLLAAGADQHYRDKRGCLPADYAAAGGHGAVAAALEVAAAEEAAEAGRRAQEVSALLAAGTDPNALAEGGHGLTLLQLAARKGQVEAVQALLQAGADVDARERQGRTALHLAARRGHAAVVACLVAAGAAVGLQASGLQGRPGPPDQGLAPLHLAAISGCTSTVRALLEAGADPLQGDADALELSPLHLAAEHGQAAALSVLLKEGNAPADVVDVCGCAPLYFAASSRAPGAAACVRVLAAAGADLELEGEGWRPLGWAAKEGNAAVVAELLAAGAHIHGLGSMSDDTPLHIAAWYGREAAAAALLEGGADVDRRDESGFTPLMRAAAEGHAGMVRLLLAAGAALSAVESEDRRTALHLAASSGAAACVEVLLAAGADPQAKDRYECLPLHALADRCQRACTYKPQAVPGADYGGAVAALVAAGADPSAMDPTGATALHLVTGCTQHADEGWPERPAEVVWALVAAGAAVDALDEQGHTPLWCLLAGTPSQEVVAGPAASPAAGARRAAAASGVAAALVECGASLERAVEGMTAGERGELLICALRSGLRGAWLAGLLPPADLAALQLQRCTEAAFGGALATRQLARVGALKGLLPSEVLRRVLALSCLLAPA